MPGTSTWSSNGVDPQPPSAGRRPDPDVVCFVGIFSWAPNIDGAEWLVREVLPLLPARMRIELVGRKPHRRVQDLAGPRVTVTGEVPDTLAVRRSGQRRAGAAAGARWHTPQDPRGAAGRASRRGDAGRGRRPRGPRGQRAGARGRPGVVRGAAWSSSSDDPRSGASSGRAGRSASSSATRGRPAARRLLDLYDGTAPGPAPEPPRSCATSRCPRSARRRRSPEGARGRSPDASRHASRSRRSPG